MKKKYSILAAIFFTVFFAGCVGNFEEINTDETKVEEMNIENIAYFFANAVNYGSIQDIGTYNIIPQWHQDFWVQYFTPVGTSETDRFDVLQWFFFHWDGIYYHTLPHLDKIIELTEGVDAPANALARIWKVYSMHILTDLYGPVPYTEAGKGLLSTPYDSQESIYNDFFVLLDGAVAGLKEADPSARPYGDEDVIYGGNTAKWMKFANSLRLRLAMRISYVDPARAKAEAEEAVAAGVMTDVQDDAMIRVTANSQNPLNFIVAWNSMCMSGAMESYMKGYADPRMYEYFSPNKNGLYHGIPNGLVEREWTAQPYKTMDSLNNAGPRFSPDLMNENPYDVMYAAESYFLRAEGALNGWAMGGSAKELYEQGIRTSMRQWGINDEAKIDAYISNTGTPVPLHDHFNTPAVSDIPVAFSSEPDVQLQQVITQKWLALFPNACESWSELRRTGFPELYPIKTSSNPDVAPNSMIRRIPFVSTEKDMNAAAVEAATKLLGPGGDKASTRLWWNVVRQ
ncbi:MAG: SusD/RagB family nutrient-binding outer membrane lipoprotein [Prolixibacteraceae bacterium]